MSNNILDAISDEMRWRKIEQFMEQTKADIIQLMKRAPQRQHEYMGHLPHAADAFAGVTGGGAAMFFKPVLLLGKTDAAHDKGSSGTVSIWSGDPGSEVDTTVNETAYNAFADLASGKWCVLGAIGSNYYLIAGECE